jgi:hypothetical protein
VKKKKLPCLMCEDRPGRILKAVTRRGAYGLRQTYVNATKLPVFCSMKCAANYALLWVEGHDWDRLEELGHEEYSV